MVVLNYNYMDPIQQIITRINETIANNSIKVFHPEIKNRKLHIEVKDPTAQIKKEMNSVVPDLETDKKCREARKKANLANANIKRDMSNLKRSDMNMGKDEG